MARSIDVTSLLPHASETLVRVDHVDAEVLEDPREEDRAVVADAALEDDVAEAVGDLLAGDVERELPDVDELRLAPGLLGLLLQLLLLQAEPVEGDRELQCLYSPQSSSATSAGLSLTYALGYRLHLVVGAALLALYYLSDYGVVRDVDVCVALVTLCLQLASHLSFQIRAHLRAEDFVVDSLSLFSFSSSQLLSFSICFLFCTTCRLDELWVRPTGTSDKLQGFECIEHRPKTRFINLYRAAGDFLRDLVRGSSSAAASRPIFFVDGDADELPDYLVGLAERDPVAPDQLVGQLGRGRHVPLDRLLQPLRRRTSPTRASRAIRETMRQRRRAPARGGA